MHNKTLLAKIILAVVGTVIMSLGINLVLGINWGMSTFDTACLTALHLLGIEAFGDAALVVHGIFIVLIIIFMKKLDVDWKLLLSSIISIFIVSRVLNFFDFAAVSNYSSLLTTLISFVVSVFLINLGIYLMAMSNLIVTPYDRFVVQLSKVTNRELGKTRLVVDLSLFAVATVLIIIFNLPIPISLATLYIVVLSGPMITACGRIFKLDQ